MTTVKYARYFQKYEEEFQTFDEALTFAGLQSDAGEVFVIEIIDGDKVYDGEELSDMIWDYVDKFYDRLIAKHG